MNPSILLDEAVHQQLEALIHDDTLRPIPSPARKQALGELLAAAKITRNPGDLENRVSLHDRVTLVSPRDSRDFFNLQVVMPSEADLDADRVSVLTPICLAVLGRHSLESVRWETPAGDREMRIIAIGKFEPAGV